MLFRSEGVSQSTQEDGAWDHLCFPLHPSWLGPSPPAGCFLSLTKEVPGGRTPSLGQVCHLLAYWGPQAPPGPLDCDQSWGRGWLDLPCAPPPFNNERRIVTFWRTVLGETKGSFSVVAWRGPGPGGGSGFTSRKENAPQPQALTPAKVESSTTNKASGGDRIPVELFQILKDDAVKVLHSICQQIWKTQHSACTHS